MASQAITIHVIRQLQVGYFSAVHPKLLNIALVLLIYISCLHLKERGGTNKIKFLPALLQ